MWFSENVELRSLFLLLGIAQASLVLLLLNENVGKIIASNILDIHLAYGEKVRGNTLSSRSQRYVCSIVKEAGVDIVIGLRNDEPNRRMMSMA